MGLPFRETALKWANRLYDRATTVLQYVDHGQGARYYLNGQSFQERGLHESAIKAFSRALEYDGSYISEDEEVAYFQRG